jgi:alpha-1,3-mannosyltransferase
MLIVHVVRQFHPGVGGLENGVLDLASAQIAAGIRVRVVTLDRLFSATKGPPLPPRETINGIEVVRIPYFGSPRYPIALSVLRHVGNADLVHVHAIDFFFDYMAWTKPIHRRKLVVSTHGGFFHTPYAARLKRLWFATITRLSLKFYAAVIAISTSDFERFRPLRHEGMVFIENGANVDKFYDASSRHFKKSIVSIGRFAKNKRMDLLITFALALKQYDPEWRLTIAGRPGNLRADELRALVDDAGLSDTVNVIASPTDHAVKSLVHDSSFVAISSDYEGFGMVAVEGMSAGLFPLLSGIAPFRRLVDRTGLGMILDYARPYVAARQLIHAWAGIAKNYPELRASCMKASLAYDWRNVSEKMVSLYRDVTGTGVRTILGVPVRVRSADEAVRQIDGHFERRERTSVAFANAHALNIATENVGFRDALQNALVLNDGIGIDIASRLLYGSPFPENLNGTDFSPNYLRQTKHRYRIFLLGAKPGTAERAAERLSILCPQHSIVGCHHGHFDAGELASVIDRIRSSKAEVLLVAMGNPKQELFLRHHLAATGCTLGFGVGALFDFLAGNVPRAMPLVQRLRVEWVFRLGQEPRRLARRYLIGNPLFLLRIAKQWWSDAPLTGFEPDFCPSRHGEDFAVQTTANERSTATQEAMSA